MSQSDLLHFEDMSPGTIFPLGAASILGGLAASGWHSSSMMMRMMTDSYLLRTAAEGAPGVDYVKWKKPVLAGDVLTGETRVLDRRQSRSRPGIGIVSLRHELRNQNGHTVLESENPVMVRLRPDAGARP